MRGIFPDRRNPPQPPFDKGGGHIAQCSRTKGFPLVDRHPWTKGSPLVKGGAGGICFFALIAALSITTPAFSQSAPAIPDPLTPQSIARSRADMETRMAVARLGARVCRELRIGISERDWIRGVVIDVDGDRVEIMIEQPGRFSHTLNGTTIMAGSVVLDTTNAWTPCL